MIYNILSVHLLYWISGASFILSFIDYIPTSRYICFVRIVFYLPCQNRIHIRTRFLPYLPAIYFGCKYNYLLSHLLQILYLFQRASFTPDVTHDTSHIVLFRLLSQFVRDLINSVVSVPISYFQVYLLSIAFNCFQLSNSHFVAVVILLYFVQHSLSWLFTTALVTILQQDAHTVLQIILLKHLRILVLTLRDLGSNIYLTLLLLT